MDTGMSLAETSEILFKTTFETIASAEYKLKQWYINQAKGIY